MSVSGSVISDDNGSVLVDGGSLWWKLYLQKYLLYPQLGHGLLLAVQPPRHHGDLLPKQFVLVVDDPLLLLDCVLQGLQTLQNGACHLVCLSRLLYAVAVFPWETWVGRGGGGGGWQEGELKAGRFPSLGSWLLVGGGGIQVNTGVTWRPDRQEVSITTVGTE